MGKFASEVTNFEVAYYPVSVKWFIEYIRLLAKDDDELTLTVGDLWRYYERTVRDGEHHADVQIDLLLPQVDLS